MRRNHILAFLSLVASLVLTVPNAARAQCPALPNNLTNDTTADATQVMANLNALLGCINTNVASRGLFSGQMSSAIPSQSSTGLVTWLNQGTATVSNDANGMYFMMPSNGSANIARGLYGPAPTPPYTRTILLLYNEFNVGASYVLFGWYDRSHKLQTIGFLNNANQGWFTWNSFSSIQTVTPFAIPILEFLWVRLADDGTNYTMSYSFDGVHFYTITTGAKSSGWLTSSGYSNIFVGCDCYASVAHFTVLSYQ
jgi:hypothetical protein